ncbi:DUF1501 domain-containing protein [Zhongshania sp.]|uniref:DUF1501 domain-containing protein n=1 Tax=Zhongshania sp. TaxID=1971902 RepID=UPI003567C0DD
MNELKRRQFLKLLSAAGATTSLGGATSLFPTLARANELGDYKALVVLFLHGGNDSFNMLVPLGSEAGTGYQSYAESRGIMAINNSDLNPFASSLGAFQQRRLDDGSNPYASTDDASAYKKGVYKFNDVGINGMMPELAQLIIDRKASVVANIGTLVEPVTKETLQTAKLPPFLYAHNHQQRAIETGWADNLSAGGWAGRLADMWGVHQGAINGGSPLGMNVSYAGATRLMTADYNSPVVLSPGSTQLFPNNAGFDKAIFNSLNSPSSNDQALHRVFKAASSGAVALSDTLAQIDTAAFDTLQDPYGNPLFTNPSAGDLGLSKQLPGRALNALKSAAHMVKLGSELGLGRQIVFVGMGGFDTHSALLNTHPLLLREISLATWSFQAAMDSLDLAEKVTLFSASDFGRSLGNNGDGTDHAWAGHNILVGGAVNGGAMIGAMPDMTLGGASDTGKKGRMIPTLAVDQYLATLCSWFGVEDNDMTGLFPNLENFKSSESDPISSAYLPGMLNTQATTEGNLLTPVSDLLSQLGLG